MNPQERVNGYVLDKVAKAEEQAALNMFANERRDQRVSGLKYLTHVSWCIMSFKAGEGPCFVSSEEDVNF
jgi:hypothetical protein